MIEPLLAHPFAWTPQPWGRAVQSVPLARVAFHLFTTRDLPLRGPRAGDGWAQLAATLGVSPSRLIRLKQVHGAEVVVVRRQPQAADVGAAADSRAPDNVPGSISVPRNRADYISVDAQADADRPRADIVMTDDPGVAIVVQAADCVPLLLADPVTGAVAAVHAGWRGTAAGVARVAVSAMTSHFGTRPADLVAAVGPSIGACCYQVGRDVLDAFRAAALTQDDIRDWFDAEEEGERERGGDWWRKPSGQRAPAVDWWRPASGQLAPAVHSWRRASALRDAGRKYRLDVPRANVDQLRAAGLDPAHVTTCGLCTACHPSVFPSYRRDGAGAGRLAGVIRPGSRPGSRQNGSG
jgi:hypothetical protein